MNQFSFHDVTIIIPTRNRPSQLRETLSIIADSHLVQAKIIVVDDDSDDPAANKAVVECFPGIRLVLHSKRSGQSGARNTGLKAANTTFCLLLDDDTHVENPEALYKFLQSPAHLRGAVWRFETIRQYDGYRDRIPVDFPQQIINRFIGFGVLLHRERVTSVGGFRDFFIYRKEEEDLAVRLFQANYSIMYVPGIRVIHRHQPNFERSADEIREYEMLSTRNLILYHGLNFPFPLGVLEGIARAIKMTVLGRSMRLFRFKGCLKGLFDLGRNWAQRTPLSWSQLGRWRSLGAQIDRSIRSIQDKQS
jgi:GT2 family glycosyltransferase